MKRLVVFLLAGFTVSLLASSCAKYEDGPGLSFRSRKQRVINNWGVDVAFDVNTEKDVTEDFENYTVTLREDGTLEARTFDPINDTTYVQLGLWDLVDNDNRLRFLYTDPPVYPDRDFWNILRLTENNLWVTLDPEYTLDTNLYEIRFVTAEADTTQ